MAFALFGTAAAITDDKIRSLSLEKVVLLYAGVGLLFVGAAALFGFSRKVPAGINEEKTEKAKLDYINAEDSTLYLSPGFPIEILGPKENAQTGGSSFGSSLWVPLVAGAAGAALGNLAASRLSSPQYVSPPTPNGTGNLLQGFDDRQVSKTPPPSKSTSSYKEVAQKKKKSYSSFQPNKSSRKFKSKRRR